MKIGGHCVLFGQQVATDTEEVFGKLAYAGAEGCELGERFFGTENREKLQVALEKNEIRLAGMHANNFKLIDALQDPEKAETALMTVGYLVASQPDKNIIATGGSCFMDQIKNMTIGQGMPEEELHDPEKVKQMAQNVETIVRHVKEATGAQVHYHNHSWEFADNGLIWFSLAEYAPSLKFALDTGWAKVSGFDPVELLQKYPGRFSYVHLRDLQENKIGDNLPFSRAHSGFAELGTGCMNYPRLMRCLNQTLGDDGWAIVEYELGNFDQYSYAKAINYVRGIRDML